MLQSVATSKKKFFGSFFQKRTSSSRLRRSAGIRFAALYALLFAASALALTSFLWWATAGLLQRQTDAAIRADAQGLIERFEEGGPRALIATIDDRLAENVDDDAIYLLANATGERLAGDLDHWPADMTVREGWSELPIQRPGLRSVARATVFDLSGGLYLMVGRDVHVRVQMRSLLTGALLSSLLVVVVLASIGAVVMRTAFRRAMATLSQTAAAISAGDLTRRMPLSGRGDEFDRLAETVNDMLERIGRLMEGVRAVSNAIAHDLRTPITRARARLEDAALHAEGADDLRAAIERAQSDLDGVIAVFQALLRIAEIEAGSRRSAFAAFDLSPVLADLAELYGAVADERGVILELSVPPHLPAFGDREMIQQAVANLLDNAVKFSPAGGTIRLTAEGGGLTRIAVADQGQGIAEADQPHVGERFFRAEAARSTPGCGLGLALVTAVAQLHGGALLLSHGPGLTATLTIAGES